MRGRRVAGRNFVVSPISEVPGTSVSRPREASSSISSPTNIDQPVVVCRQLHGEIQRLNTVLAREFIVRNHSDDVRSCSSFFHQLFAVQERQNAVLQGTRRPESPQGLSALLHFQNRLHHRQTRIVTSTCVRMN